MPARLAALRNNRIIDSAPLSLQIRCGKSFCSWCRLGSRLRDQGGIGMTRGKLFLATIVAAFSVATAVPLAWAASVSRVSVATGGKEADGESYDPAISADGRYVAFVSTATNLVIGDTNGVSDVFLRDRVAGTTTRVSVSNSGAQASGASGVSTSVKAVAISATGRYVAFSSDAKDLVVGDTNGTTDVFVRDRVLKQTTRVSVTASGGQSSGTSGRWGIAISADGRYVAFGALATLVPGDTNAAHDVYLRDRTSRTTERVSVRTGGAQGTLASMFPSISADGRYIAFTSLAGNLVIGDTNNDDDVFVRDRVAKTTTRVSVANSGAGGDRNSGRDGLAISADGLIVGFASDARNLVVGDSNLTTDVFVHGRTPAFTSRVSVSTGGNQADSFSYLPAVSGNGRFVAFASPASNLFPNFNGRTGIYVRDRSAGTTTRIIAGLGHSGQKGIAISSDGRAVAFQSYAGNLVTGDNNGVGDVFVYQQ
ncbi:MAG: hypothetical protein U1E38_09705 [Rhodospirillales bacterium]